MRFEYSDAWLLQAIKLSENGDNGTTLIGIIQAADYINHAIITWREFSIGTKKLKSIGIVVEKNRRLQTTQSFNEWWTIKFGRKNRVYIMKATEEIERYLNSNFATADSTSIEITTEISHTDWDISISDYQKIANEITVNVTSKKGKK
ncbi:MAG: hypothetical protein QM762_18000 [Chryseolinea sp.]